MSKKEFDDLSTRSLVVSRYEAYCTSLPAHGRVAPSRNGMTIPRRRALPCTGMNAHCASSNYGI
jgi:hypothetical protein